MSVKALLVNVTVMAQSMFYKYYFHGNLCSSGEIRSGKVPHRLSHDGMSI